MSCHCEQPIPLVDDSLDALNNIDACRRLIRRLWWNQHNHRQHQALTTQLAAEIVRLDHATRLDRTPAVRAFLSSDPVLALRQHEDTP